MQYKIIDERPWQILSNAMTIGPSSTGYQLQVAADGRNYTTLFTVSAGITRQITNLSSGSYFRMKGNVGEVTVNWVRDCSGGGGGNAGELEPVNEFPVDAPAGTVVALASGDTVGVYQYDGTDWAPIGGGDMSNYYTKAETDAAITSATQDFVTEADITAATSPIQEQVDDIERVTATALTELHDSILELSGATGDYATEAYVDAAITGATQDFVSEEDLTGYTSQQDFQDFQDAISVKEEVIASAITELHDSIPDVSDFVTTGDIQSFVTSGDVATQISSATQNMVESTSVSTIVTLTQAQYDALAVKDPHTFYIITNS